MTFVEQSLKSQLDKMKEERNELSTRLDKKQHEANELAMKLADVEEMRHQQADARAVAIAESTALRMNLDRAEDLCRHANEELEEALGKIAEQDRELKDLRCDYADALEQIKKWQAYHALPLAKPEATVQDLEVMWLRGMVEKLVNRGTEG